MKTEYSEGKIWNMGHGYDDKEKSYMTDVKKYDEVYGTGYSTICNNINAWKSIILYGFLASEVINENKVYSVAALSEILGCTHKAIKVRIGRSQGYIVNEKEIALPKCDVKILKECEIIFGKYEKYLEEEN